MHKLIIYDYSERCKGKPISLYNNTLLT